MLQTSFDHLTLQLISVLLNGWVHHEFMIPRSIGFDLLPNVIVIANKPFVGHIFHAHSQLSPTHLSRRLWRASPRELCSWGLSERRFSQSDDRCCTRKYAAQRLVRPARFEPIPSCVCRWDTSVVQQWNVSYAYPTFAPTERKGRTEICSSELLLDVVGEALLLEVVERASALPSRARAVFKSILSPVGRFVERPSIRTQRPWAGRRSPARIS